MEKIAPFIIGIFLFITFFNNYSFNNFSRNYIAYDYNINIINTIQDRALAFLNGDNITFPQGYLYYVEMKNRKAIFLDDLGSVFTNIYGSNFLILPKNEQNRIVKTTQLSIIRSASKRVYFTLGSNLSNNTNIKSIPVGLLYVIPLGKKRVIPSIIFWRRYNLRLVKTKDYLNKELISQVHFFLGEYYFNKCMSEEAIKEYRKASRFDIDELTRNIAISLNKKGFYKETLDFLRGKSDEYSCVNRGIAYFNQGFVEEAIKEYNSAISLNPENSEAHINLGVAYEKKDLISDAIEQYKKVISIDSYNLYACYNLGIVFRRQGMLGKAIDFLKRCIEIDPYFVKAYVSLGVTYGKKGMLKDAVYVFKRALSIQPFDPEIYYNLGVAYIKIGSINNARKMLKKVLSLAPSHIRAKMALKSILDE